MNTNPVRDQLIADAKNLPDLVQAARVADPVLAEALTGKALIASKTVWGNAISTLIAWVVSRYGLGWDPNTCALISGLVLLAASAIIRSISAGPIAVNGRDGHCRRPGADDRPVGRPGGLRGIRCRASIGRRQGGDDQGH